MSIAEPSSYANGRLAELAQEQAELARFFKGFLVFVFVWPLVCGAIVASWWSVLDGTKIFGRDNLYVLMLAYLFGFFPAAVIGSLISGFQIRTRSFGIIHVVLIGLVIGTMFGFMQSTKPPDYHGIEAFLNGLVKVATCVLSTLLCWLIIRCWRTRQD